jgi:hypothetical protein
MRYVDVFVVISYKQQAAVLLSCARPCMPVRSTRDYSLVTSAGTMHYDTGYRSGQ